MPRCDLLVWILVTKLAPSYYVKLDRLLVQTGRYRELCSWRKDFKKEWRNLETRQITFPINDAYKPRTDKWTCTCPAFVTSRFLICKHLIQDVERVPPVFFLEVKRHRTAPFWRHKALKLNQDRAIDEGGAQAQAADDDDNDEGGADDEDDDLDFDDVVEARGDGSTFEEAINADIDLIAEFVQSLRHQVQFRDQRMLNALEREGAGFLRLARACMGKEKRLQSTRGRNTCDVGEVNNHSHVLSRKTHKCRNRHMTVESGTLNPTIRPLNHHVNT